MKKTVLVTGASGFVGSAVVRKLVKRKNIDLHCVVSPHSEAWRLKGFEGEMSISKVDLSNPKSVNTLIKKNKPDAIIHLATHGVYSHQQENIKRIVEDNYMMAVNLLEVAKRFGTKKFINTGSVFEYGSKFGKMRERDSEITDVLNRYSAVKLATTALVSSYADDFKVITIRPFTVYGPYGDKSRFIMANILRALKDEPIRIVNGVIRDFVYVEDVADGFIKALTGKFDSGDIINLGSSRKHFLEEVVRLIKKFTNSDSKVIIDRKYKRDRESRCWADISRAKKVLNWAPKYNLEEGLKKTILWVKKNY